MRGARWAALLCALAGLAPAASAHPLAPSLLELREVGPRRVEVSWKTPLWRAPGSALQPVLPPECTRVAPPRARADETSVALHWTVDCGEGGLAGRRVAVDGLEESRTSVVLRVRLAGGGVAQALLRPGAAGLAVPRQPSRWTVFRDYAGLGAAHVATGPDHLLFLLGLLLLVPDPRRLLATISAFTVGHSATLCLAVLGAVDVPPRPIELLIAASVLTLAVELARSGSERRSWLRRSPWRMAGGFGLLHGLGFAAALREAGLPAGEIPAALVAFNVGVEAAQALFVASALALATALRPALRGLPRPAARIPVYAMGSLAAAWCMQRAAGLLG
jgi:hydrogenase/urease accessory protein HupE